MTIPITWTERSRIPNLPQLLDRLRSNGGRIVEFQRVWSLLLYCQSYTVYRWVPSGRSRIISGLGHALFCLAFGWWSPAGIIWTLPAAVNDLFGGVDVTHVLTQPPPLPGKPWESVAAGEYIAARKRQGWLTLVSLVFVVGSLFYLGWRDVTGDRKTRAHAESLMSEETQALKLRMAKYGKERDIDGSDVYIKIAEAIRPLERWRKYEDPILAALRQGNLGEVIGGGAMTTQDGIIEYCGIDAVIADPPEAAIAVIKAVMQKAGAPKGSQIEFEDSDKIIPILDD